MELVELVELELLDECPELELVELELVELELVELVLLDDPVPPPLTESETREGSPVPEPQKPKLVLPPGAITAS